MSKSNPEISTNLKEPAISQPTPPKQSPLTAQLAAFDEAMKLFHQRDFAGALPLFEEAAKGSEISIAHTAKMHAKMCQQRIERAVPPLKTVEDYYAYGVALTNRRDLGQAEQILQKALAMAPQGDHIVYALALVKGLQGDLLGAATMLTRAIELQPANRNAARNDPDFQELLMQSPLRELVYTDKSAGR